MNIRVLDQTGQQFTADQIKELNIWNETMSHICASVLERLSAEDITSSQSVAKAKSP